MSDALEHLLDITLDMRDRHRRQHEDELAAQAQAAHSSYAELERRIAKFSTEVRCLIGHAAEQANRHFSNRLENLRYQEVNGYSPGQWCPGGRLCDPLVFELLADGERLGETLIVELMHDGMVGAFLAASIVPDRVTYSTRTKLDWHPVPLFSFNRERANELLVHYLAAACRAMA